MVHMHNDTMRMTIRLNAHNREVLGAASRVLNVSMSEVLDQALNEWLMHRPKSVRDAITTVVSAVTIMRKKQK